MMSKNPEMSSEELTDEEKELEKSRTERDTIDQEGEKEIEEMVETVKGMSLKELKNRSVSLTQEWMADGDRDSKRQNIRQLNVVPKLRKIVDEEFDKRCDELEKE